MKLGDSVRVGDVEIHATPAHHDSGFYWPMWHPKTVLSYVLEGSQTVFFVGDTALFNMNDIGNSHAIDLALLPVWGFGPYLRGDHMTPAEAAEALSMLMSRVAVPIHWGTLHPMGPWWKNMAFLHRPPYSFAYEASRRAPDTEVRVLTPGESTVIGRAPAREVVEDLIINPAEIQPALV